MRCLVRAIFVMVLGSFLATAGRADDEHLMVKPGDDLAKFAIEAPPGTVFVLAPGVYPVANIVPKDRQVFEGHGRAVINGAVPLTGFRKDENIWRVQGPSPIPLSHGGCDAKRWTNPVDGCLYRESLFRDGQLIARVFALADAHGDAWFQDRNSGEIVVGFDPSDHIVEISHFDAAFKGNASGVVIRGLTIEKFTPLAQYGAIQGDKSSDWTIENDVIRLNSGGGVRIGNGMRLIDNRVLENGQIGINGIGDNVTVIGNEIAHNNTQRFSPSWEAGGTKFVRTNNLLVERNCVHHNDGPGLWTDIDNRDSTIIDNVAADNGGVGIFHEISGTALIVNNLSIGNGWMGDSPWASQILVSGSIDTVVRGNRVVVAPTYGHGIYVVEEGRPNELKIAQAGPTYESHGNTITGNEIRFLGDHGAYGFFFHGNPEPTPLRTRNRFAGNTIIAGDDRPRFADDGPIANLKMAAEHGQELGSRLEILQSTLFTDRNSNLLAGCKFD
jgi:Right handed beta helix region